MASQEALSALQTMGERSPEGLGVALTAIRDAGTSRETVEELLREGLIDVVNDDDELTIYITSAGRDVLEPKNSL